MVVVHVCASADGGAQRCFVPDQHFTRIIKCDKFVGVESERWTYGVYHLKDNGPVLA